MLPAANVRPAWILDTPGAPTQRLAAEFDSLDMERHFAPSLRRRRVDTTWLPGIRYWRIKPHGRDDVQPGPALANERLRRQYLQQHHATVLTYSIRKKSHFTTESQVALPSGGGGN